MSSLASFLIIIIVLTLASLLKWHWRDIYARISRNSVPSGQPNPDTRRALCVYIALVGVILILIVRAYLGSGREGSPQLTSTRQYRIAHRGYYLQPHGELLFRGRIDGGIASDPLPGIERPELAPGESLRLSPTEWNGEKKTLSQWSVEVPVQQAPLRVNNICVNLERQAWLAPGDCLRIAVDQGAERQFCEIKWQRRSSFLFFGSQDTFEYRQGILRNGIYTYDNQEGILLPARRILHTWSVGALIRRAQETLERTWKNSGQQKKLHILESPWLDVANNIYFVRKKEGDSDSTLGLLIRAEAIQRSGIDILKNDMRLPAEVATATHSNFTVDAGAIMSYGMEANRSFAVKLPLKTIETGRYGHLLEIELNHPASWDLPPDPIHPFIITSSNTYIPLDGYTIDNGNPRAPFYAIARFDPHKPGLILNDGNVWTAMNRQPENLELTQDGQAIYPPDQPIRLGDYQQGVVVVLERLQSPIHQAGRYAELILALHTILCCLLLAKDNRKKLGRLDFAWAMLWCFSLTILVVRLVLAYRVCLSPPQDASYAEIESIFRKSFISSYWGLVGLPFAMLLTRLAAMTDKNKRLRLQNRAKHMAKRLPVTLQGLLASRLNVLMFWTLGLLPFLIAAFSVHREHILWLRTSMIVHALMVGILATVAHRVWDVRSGRNVLNFTNNNFKICAFVVYNISVILLVAIVVGDNGYLIYTFSFVAAMWVPWYAHRNQTSRSSPRIRWLTPFWLLPTSLVLMTGFVFLAPKWFPPLQERFPGLGRTTMAYRIQLQSTNFADRLLTRDAAGALEVSTLFENYAQAWQMKLYASVGGENGLGYASAPLSHQGMTYPTSLTDCVYSIYILSEHGARTGLWLLLVYVSLTFACVYGVLHLSGEYAHRTIPLLAIGGFYGYNALYMAAANVGLLPFTGQNMPLLGLSSNSDLLHNLIILCLATWLMRWKIDVVNDQPEKQLHHEELFLAQAIIACVILLVVSAIIVGRASLYLPSEAKEDFLLPEAVYKRLKDHLPGGNHPVITIKPSSQNPLIPVLEAEPYANLTAAEQWSIKRFNQAPDKAAVRNGLYFANEALDKPGSYTLQINRNLYQIASPFKSRKLWQGKLVAVGDIEQDAEPTISILGSTFSLSLQAQGQARSIDLTANAPIRGSSQVELVYGKGVDKLSFGALDRRGADLWFSPKTASQYWKWKISINGQQITKAQKLKDMDILIIDGEKPGPISTFRYSMLYHGIQAPVLAYVQWRNGAQQRVFPEGAVLPMTYALGRAADLGADYPQHGLEEWKLSIHLPLQRMLQTRLEQWARSQNDYRISEPDSGKRLAMVVLDAFTGEIKAMPSWPYADPGNPEFQEQWKEASPQGQTRMLTNHNLGGHVLGSTLKPFVFSALSLQFQQTSLLRDLGNVNVISHGVEHRNIGGIPFEPLYKCDEAQTMSASDFFIYSRDWPEIVFGSLGTLLQPTDETQVLRRVYARRDADMEIQGRGGGLFALELRRVADRASAFTLNDAMPRPNTVNMPKTLLYTGLPKLFHVFSETEEPHKDTCNSFLPSLQDYLMTAGRYHAQAGSAKLFDNPDIQHVLPEPVHFHPSSFQNIRGDFLSFLLGAGDCRWNNVTLAESAARIATGTRVEATLERRETKAALPPALPGPLGIQAWRQKRIIEPLRLVGKIGTAAALKNVVPDSYIALYKTGTVQEHKDDVNSEMLLFVIGRQDSHHRFIPGQTIAGYLYLEDSNPRRASFRKFDLAARLIKEIIPYISPNKNGGSEAVNGSERR